MTRLSRLALWAGVLAFGLGVAAAHAADKIRVGKSVPHILAYTPIDIGLAKGFFQEEGLELEVKGFNGASKQDLALTAGAIDIGLSSGPGMIFIDKGLPVKAVAAMLGRPYLTMIVPYDSPVKSMDDLKGKTIAVSSVASVTNWVAHEIGRRKGWPAGAIKTSAIGGHLATTRAAIVTHQVDAVVESNGVGFSFEEQKIGRIVAHSGDYIKDFIMHVIFARNEFIAKNPDAVRRFVKAWFKTIAWMNAHPDEALKITQNVTHYSDAVAKREFDAVLPTWSKDGKFDAKALKVLAKSYVDAGQAKTEPDMTRFYTEQFLPK